MQVRLLPIAWVTDREGQANWRWQRTRNAPRRKPLGVRLSHLPLQTKEEELRATVTRARLESEWPCQRVRGFESLFLRWMNAWLGARPGGVIRRELLGGAPELESRIGL